MAIVYFIGMKPPVDFWLPENNTTLIVMRSKLDNLLSHAESTVDQSSFVHHLLHHTVEVELASVTTYLSS